MSQQPNHGLRAYHAWDVLIQRASESKTMTYKELAAKVGVHHRVCRYFLDYIQNYCLVEELPPLTSIVVNQEGKIGNGFHGWDVNNLEEGQKKVYAFNWSMYPNPFLYALSDNKQSDLVNILVKSGKSTEVYTTVKVRGIAQELFRKALLELYGGRCAFCGFRIPEALEAAHIVPWSQAGDSEKLDVRNGILLCSNHHKLFDKNIYVLKDDYTIGINGNYTSKLVGRTIRFPQNKECIPNREYIQRRLALIN